MTRPFHPAIDDFLAGEYNVEALDGLKAELQTQGTFHFPSFENGLFPAANFEAEKAVGYENVWVRDNVHIAHSLWRCDDPMRAVRAVRMLMHFFQKHKQKFSQILDGSLDPADPMNRPHIRFNGETLEERPEKWSHAQNDALGYFLWLFCEMSLANRLKPGEDDLEVLGLLAAYFDKIEYWQDEDSGHWEETRKVNASSIGVVVASLGALIRLMEKLQRDKLGNNGITVSLQRVGALLAKGITQLRIILPAECIQTDPMKFRPTDGALIFLIYPLRTVTGEIAEAILHGIGDLEGSIGVRRYRGDSYWCADYKEKLALDERTADFSDDITARNRLLREDEEAQWCIFDPILSVIHGLRFEQSGSIQDWEEQQRYFHRALTHLTDSGSTFGALRCPESYYIEKGQYVPNDVTPLLWTQANLLLAFQQMRKSLVRKSQG